MKIIITGSAGFIGFHASKLFLSKGFEVVGIDSLTRYYDVNLKKRRNEILKKFKSYSFYKIDICDDAKLKKVFKKEKPDVVIHLAAQAGVRYSIENPKSYINSNLVGFANILEMCRQYPVKNFIYASSSSVYGGNKNKPFSEFHKVDKPISLYAATKKSNELMAHVYSHLYNISTTGLRFFTVYGPWGRPDMAPMIFAKAILQKKTLKIYNYGQMSRSFTYIDDVVEIVLNLINKPALPDKFFNPDKPNSSCSWCPHRIFNIGNENAVELNNFISLLEDELGFDAIKEYSEIEKGDVINTLSDNTLISEWIGEYPRTNIKKGMSVFINWFKSYYSF